MIFPYGLGFVWFIAAFACLIGMNFTVRRSRQLRVGLLAAFGLLVGLAMAPVLPLAESSACGRSGG